MNSFVRVPWKCIWVKHIILYIFIFILHVLIFLTCFSKSPCRDFIPYNKKWRRGQGVIEIYKMKFVSYAVLGSTFLVTIFIHHPDYDQYFLSQ